MVSTGEISLKDTGSVDSFCEKFITEKEHVMDHLKDKSQVKIANSNERKKKRQEEQSKSYGDYI